MLPLSNVAVPSSPASNTPVSSPLPLDDIESIATGGDPDSANIGGFARLLAQADFVQVQEGDGSEGEAAVSLQDQPPAPEPQAATPRPGQRPLRLTSLLSLAASPRDDASVCIQSVPDSEPEDGTPSPSTQGGSDAASEPPDEEISREAPRAVRTEGGDPAASADCMISPAPASPTLVKKEAELTFTVRPPGATETSALTKLSTQPEENAREEIRDTRVARALPGPSLGLEAKSTEVSALLADRMPPRMPTSARELVFEPASADAAREGNVEEAASGGRALDTAPLRVTAALVSSSAPPQALFAGKVVVADREESSANHNISKNSVEYAAKKIDANRMVAGGMEKAKAADAMPAAPAHASSFSAPLRERDGAEWVAGMVFSAPSGVPAAREPSALPGADVNRVLARVSEVADQLVARQGDPVRLTLELGSEQRVEVKVALRGGLVFADFRSNSPELQSELARGWHEFTRSREAAGTRWGESSFGGREFAAPAPLVSSPSSSNLAGDQGGDASARRELAGDSRHHSPRREAPEHAATSFVVRPAPRGNSAPSSAPIATPSSRADTVRHLSALA